MNSLTTQDIDLAMRALDALSQQPFHDAFASGLIRVVTSKDKMNDGEQHELAEAVHAEAERKLAADRDDIILLKAKLIEMRRDLVHKDLFKFPPRSGAMDLLKEVE